MIQEVSKMIGIELPIIHELHLKVSMKDNLGVLPREAPLLIWEDPQYLSWDDEECQILDESSETRWLLDKLPSPLMG
jgi:hypothetical protein